MCTKRQAHVFSLLKNFFLIALIVTWLKVVDGSSLHFHWREVKSKTCRSGVPVINTVARSKTKLSENVWKKFGQMGKNSAFIRSCIFNAFNDKIYLLLNYISEDIVKKIDLKTQYSLGKNMFSIKYIFFRLVFGRLVRFWVILQNFWPTGNTVVDSLKRLEKMHEMNMPSWLIMAGFIEVGLSYCRREGVYLYTMSPWKTPRKSMGDGCTYSHRQE
jgi:hypothetical protein